MKNMMGDSGHMHEAEKMIRKQMMGMMETSEKKKKKKKPSSKKMSGGMGMMGGM